MAALHVNHQAGYVADSYRDKRPEPPVPYVLAQMKVAAERGIPPMRPLFFGFPDDTRAAAVADQFLFGPDLLVAPITVYRGRERRVYLPAGRGVERRLERRPRARRRHHRRRGRPDRTHPGLHPRPRPRFGHVVPGVVRTVAECRPAGVPAAKTERQRPCLRVPGAAGRRYRVC